MAGGEETVSSAQSVQRVIGGVLAIVGFFVAAYPNLYSVPFLELLLPVLTLQQKSYSGFVLFLVGLFLFTRKKPIFRL